MSRIAHVVIPVPAQNEEALLGQCLRRLSAAARNLNRHHPRISVDIVVALDRCTDNSAAVVARFRALGVLSRASGVGGTRDTAIRAGLARASGHSPSTVWIANTDADTIVPAHWLSAQIALADAGTDLILGTVEPTWGVDPELLARWRERHQLMEGHGHVHGANLGLRATAWLRAGGFHRLTRNEDIVLVSRLRDAGVPTVATDRIRARTSARLSGRVDAGFAGYLTDLAESITPSAATRLQPAAMYSAGQVRSR